jgi:hypothetical protein
MTMEEHGVGKQSWPPTDRAGRPGMQSVALTASGYLMTYEICATRGCAVFTTRSADGLRWPQNIGKRVDEHVCGPFLISLDMGRVMLTSRRVAYGDNRTPISVSADGGATWVHLAPSFPMPINTGSGPPSL